MLVLWLLVGALELFSVVLGLLPDDTLTYPDTGSFGTYAGALIGPLDVLVPLSEVVACVVLTITVVVPFKIVFKLTLFVWSKIPVIGS